MLKSRLAEYVYLALTGLGFVGGVYFITQISLDHQGFDVVRFFTEITLTPSANLLAYDLTITGLAFFCFLFFETRRLKLKLWWLPVLGTFLVGLCFSVPLFFWLRERQIRQLDSVKGSNLPS
jgi:hypothetical protein